MGNSGLADCFRSDSVCLVEWPERVGGLLPAAGPRHRRWRMPRSERRGRDCRCVVDTAAGERCLSRRSDDASRRTAELTRISSSGAACASGCWCRRRSCWCPRAWARRRAHRVRARVARAGVHARHRRVDRAARAPVVRAAATPTAWCSISTASTRRRNSRNCRRACRRPIRTSPRSASARKSPNVAARRARPEERGGADVFALKPVAEFGHRLVLDLYPLMPLDPLMALLESRAREGPGRAGADAARPCRRARDRPRTSGPRASPRRGASRSRSTRATAARIRARSAGAAPTRRTSCWRSRRKLKARVDARAQHARDAHARRRLFRAAGAARAEGAARAGRPVHLDPRRRVSRADARGSSVFALSESGATSAAAKWLAQKENSADLIGGVDLDRRDPVLARTLLDLSQTAQISDSLKVGRHVLDGHRHAQRAAQGDGRAGGLRRAEGARHSVDPGRDGVHLQSGRGAEAAQRTPPAEVRRVDPRRRARATSRRTRRWHAGMNRPAGPNL